MNRSPSVGRSRTPKWRVVAPLALALSCALLAGCNYSTHTLLREDIQTINVTVFDNTTWRRGLEVELTRAVVNEVKLRTRLRLAPPQEAESTLEGELLSYSENSVVKDEDDEVLLKRATVKVRFRWVDNLTGRDIVPWQTVSESKLVALSRSDPLADTVFREAAQRVVEKMEREW